MESTRIEITTDDGICPAWTYGERGKPNVLVFMDGIGMRPAMHAIAQRVAAAGYYVLLPDMFYRAGAYTAPDPKQLFADPAVRTEWFTKISAVINPEKLLRDCKAYLAYLPQQKVGVTGYCMGGRMALAAAGTFPDRIVAAAAYHPGGVATDAPDSPHLLAGNIKAKVYVGGAMEDANFSDEQKQRLDQALTAAGVDHTIETYQARHGWVPTDTPVHDPVAAEKHWETLLDLLKRTIAT